MAYRPTNLQTDNIWVLRKKIRSKFAILRKLVTRTPVSTNRSFSSKPKKGTSGFQKKFFFPDLFLGGPREYFTEKWLKNSKKNSLVLGGLTFYFEIGRNKYFMLTLFFTALYNPHCLTVLYCLYYYCHTSLWELIKQGEWTYSIQLLTDSTKNLTRLKAFSAGPRSSF
jgi:hypothetical protein